MLVWYFVASGVRENATGFFVSIKFIETTYVTMCRLPNNKKNTPTYPYGQAGAINDFINKS